MTAQEIFDLASTHLLQQGSRAVANGRCAYRGQDGTMCPVGRLIPDELYTPDLEGLMCFDAGAMGAVMDQLGLMPHMDLLKALQGIHDFFSPDGWPRELSRLACRFGLRLPPQG